jgi:hypothetical protein
MRGRTEVGEEKGLGAGAERPVWRVSYLSSAKKKICLKHCVALYIYYIHIICRLPFIMTCSSHMYGFLRAPAMLRFI